MCRRRNNSTTKYNNSMSQLLVTNMMPLNKRNHSSILPDQHAEIIEIQGYYWPRLLLREKKDEKKVHKKVHKKANRRRAMIEFPKNKLSSVDTSSTTFTSSSITTPLLELLAYDVPRLLTENTTTTSPITGKPIVSHKKTSQLIPTKALRKQLQKYRRCQSNDTVGTLD
jgi:hypothetical protein